MTEQEKLKRMAFARLARQAAERQAHGRTTTNPEPPGDGWRAVLNDVPAFASAGLCELWRMDLGDETNFGRFNDFPPWVNLSGLWWRPA